VATLGLSEAEATRRLRAGRKVVEDAIGRPVAGKTGTAEDFTTASFVGFVPQLATAVTLADPRGPQTHPLRGVLGYAHVYGGDLPTKIWARAMRGTLDGENVPVEALPPPDATQPVVPKVVVPNLVGQPVQTAVALLQSQGLAAVVNGDPNSIVIAQSPHAGSQLDAGQPVMLVAPGGRITGLSAEDQLVGPAQPGGPGQTPGTRQNGGADAGGVGPRVRTNPRR